MKRFLRLSIAALLTVLIMSPVIALGVAGSADNLIALGMPYPIANFIGTKLVNVNTSGNLVLPVASGKKLSITVNAVEKASVSSTGVFTSAAGQTATTGDMTATAGNFIAPTAATGFVAGEAARAANVTTATTLAAPLYLSAAAAGTDLGAFVGSGVSASGPVVDMFKTRATTGAATTIVVSGDALGTLKFFGANGTTYDPAAAIVATSDATPGASADMPGAIDFQLSPDGSATLASVMKLKNSGQIQVSKAADINFNLSGGTIAIQEATAGSACSGTLTANGATPVVTSTSCATTGSRIFLSRTSAETGTVSAWKSALSTGVSFSITSEAADTGTYDWIIFHEAS